MHRQPLKSILNQEVKPRSGLLLDPSLRCGGTGLPSRAGRGDGKGVYKRIRLNLQTHTGKNQVVEGITKANQAEGSLRGAHEVAADDGLQLAATLGLEKMLQGDLNEHNLVQTRVGSDKAVNLGCEMFRQAITNNNFFLFSHLTNPCITFIIQQSNISRTVDGRGKT